MDKSQSKTLADFLVNLATAWFVAAVIAPSFSSSAFSEASLSSIIFGLVFGFSSLLSALYLSKEQNNEQ